MNKTVSCENAVSYVPGVYDADVAELSSGSNVSVEMLSRGLVRLPRYRSWPEQLIQAEEAAKGKGLGVWGIEILMKPGVNIRRGPGTEYPVARTTSGSEMATTCEYRSGWYRLNASDDLWVHEGVVAAGGEQIKLAQAQEL
jgi:hypothetical protein